MARASVQPGIAEDLPTGLGGGQGGPRAVRDNRALLLGQGGVEVQQERLDLGAQLGDQERSRAPSGC